MTTRIPVLDAWRGGLILLVVVGHVVGAAAHLASVEAGRAWFAGLYKGIYLFHMSAFFFVSGMVFREDVGARELVVRLARRLLVPYFVFGLATFLLFVGVGAAFVPKTSYYAHKFAAGVNWLSLGELLYGGALQKGVEPFVYNSVLWFLPALFTAEVLYAVWHRSLRDWKWDVLLACLVVPVSWFVLRRIPVALPFGFSRAVYYLPFFVAGRFFPLQVLAETEGKFLRVVRWTCLPLLVGFVCAAQGVRDLGLLWSSFGYYLLSFVLAAFGIVVSLSVAALCNLRFLCVCGISSLAIMLMHKPVVVALQFACPPVRALYQKGLWVGMLTSVLISVVAVVACLLAEKLIRRWLPWALGMKG